ncbi:MAG: hypothetical protein RLZZ436_3568, partial [Planctomycetota bacterium]
MKNRRDRGRPTSTRGPGLGGCAQVTRARAADQGSAQPERRRNGSTADPGKQRLPEPATAEHRSTTGSARTPNPSTGRFCSNSLPAESSSRPTNARTAWKTSDCWILPAHAPRAGYVPRAKLLSRSEPPGGSLRVKCPATRRSRRRQGRAPRCEIATGGFRPSAQDRGKHDANRTEPQGGHANEPPGGSLRVKYPATRRSRHRQGRAPRCESQPGASAHPLIISANAMPNT